MHVVITNPARQPAAEALLHVRLNCRCGGDLELHKQHEATEAVAARGT